MNDLFTRKLQHLLKVRQRRAIETTEPYAVGSTIGSVRQRNEDAGLICRVRFSDRQKDFDLAVVCDGMGGMQGGQVAAISAASTFVSSYLANDRRRPDDRLRVSVLDAQRRVFETLHGEGGTTLSALVIPRNGDAWAIHVGDSRIYDLDDGELTLLTSDQTIGSLLKGGEARPDAHRLLQFVGMDDELEPQLIRLSANQGSGYLLTSDGAHGAPHDLLRRVAKNSRSGSDAVRRLLSLADLLGGVDNATGIFLPATLDNDVAADPLGISMMVLTAAGDNEIWAPIDWLSPRDTPPAHQQIKQPLEAPVSPHQANETPKSTKPAQDKTTSTRKRKKPAKVKPAKSLAVDPEGSPATTPRQVSLKFIEEDQE